ncbi:alpha-galactosidase [Mycetocola tolaasinivorans]|uniref:alpha-galactosidase n=1 Tax=Mycetocola tolaasinivorans TaxID=76635 RepID=A0A3L7A9G9_9MICO|nr:alpha-galactosidase [Mycetocola tolaasinivorans]
MTTGSDTTSAAQTGKNAGVETEKFATISRRQNKLLVQLRAGETTLIVASDADSSPRVLHWGADLGALAPDDLEALERAATPLLGDSVITTRIPEAILPQLADGWLGLPGIEGLRLGAPSGTGWAPKFRSVGDRIDGPRLSLDLADPESGLALTLEIELEPGGLLRLRARLTNLGDTDYELRALRLAVPVPTHAEELLDFTGTWANERHPQRREFGVGLTSRESRGGKPGLDGPLLMLAGEPGFGFRSGHTYGVHLGWSGNQRLTAERRSSGERRLIAEEILAPGELVLAPLATHETPWTYASWGVGLDALAARFHTHLRSISRVRESAPVLVNTWEAAYFEHSLERFDPLARAAAAAGAEMFVLDDGWFGARDDDQSSLGDWFIDARKWPEGLRPLSDLVHSLGMDFGLWVEPEMINLDSDLARTHPEWIAQAGHGVGPASRYQHVLDLAHPEAYAWISERLHALIREIGVDYLKWDHNRYLLDAGHPHLGGRAGMRDQSRAALALMAELIAEFPGLRIESCAAGGGRIDLGVLEVSDRVWPSDNNDPLERLRVQRWTGLLVPPEIQGTHIGAATAHTTGRTSDLDTRGSVALWGNMGVELDLTALAEPERERVAGWIALHREYRPLLHHGTAVTADRRDALELSGQVSSDRDRALFLVAYPAPTGSAPTDPLRFPGLRPDVRYRVRSVRPEGAETPAEVPAWAEGNAPVLTGRMLEEVGITPPPLRPGRTALIALEAVAG